MTAIESRIPRNHRRGRPHAARISDWARFQRCQQQGSLARNTARFCTGRIHVLLTEVLISLAWGVCDSGLDHPKAKPLECICRLSNAYAVHGLECQLVRAFATGDRACALVRVFPPVLTDVSRARSVLDTSLSDVTAGWSLPDVAGGPFRDSDPFRAIEGPSAGRAGWCSVWPALN